MSRIHGRARSGPSTPASSPRMSVVGHVARREAVHQVGVVLVGVHRRLGEVDLRRGRHAGVARDPAPRGACGRRRAGSRRSRGSRCRAWRASGSTARRSSSGVMPMPTTPLLRVPARRTALGMRLADRVEPAPRVLLAEADQHLEDRAAGEVDDAVAGAVDRVGHRQDRGRRASACPSSSAGRRAATGRRTRCAPSGGHLQSGSRWGGTRPRASACGRGPRPRRGARARRARSRRSWRRPRRAGGRSAWRSRAIARVRSARARDHLRQQRVVVRRDPPAREAGGVDADVGADRRRPGGDRPRRRHEVAARGARR